MAVEEVARFEQRRRNDGRRLVVADRRLGGGFTSARRITISAMAFIASRVAAAVLAAEVPDRWGFAVPAVRLAG
jgi:hypothetical protein